jgi:microcystin-dependent protein
MADPYVGEIRLFAGTFAPVGWAFCAGQILPISENEPLFTLIGTTYGGDGQETFALPNLQGRVAIHAGQGSGLSTYQLGESGGSEQVTLTANQIPSHTHAAVAGATGTSDSPANGFWASSSVKQFATVAPTDTMAAPMTAAGGSQPHDNMLPSLGLSFIIAIFGVFPTQI